mmetsp:Transcript_37144/g.93158  ORF Transcript_37144/g.93158 Transcript_37144/m.93158 type:complete len:450 (-) Transcript_37144:277-1626(-)|eukprot:CAMPEP_0115265636 /NCGR_PEP_ID=MMETSP0270-20121206/51050_1 /TAXON_ID=71861 /ORGANISM="Scrippsiella trochoidea, Strain CCMP3099" /LENGTH=449 /DNA_ID=CAMNT_0002681699 /DNA_START=3 /DNA_END=1352 /DNA_ORIENTATION=+
MSPQQRRNIQQQQQQQLLLQQHQPQPHPQSQLQPQPQLQVSSQLLKDSANGTCPVVAQLKACAHSGDVALAEKLMCQILEEEVEAVTVDMYNYVIHACATAHNAERAESHIGSMEKLGLDPNLVTYNSMINACAALGDAARAESWLLRMVTRGVQPSYVTYGTICKVFARKGMVSQVQAIMDMIERNEGSLNEYFYASLIAACGAATPPNETSAIRAFSDLVARGLRPQSVKRALERVIGQHKTGQLFSSLSACQPPKKPAPLGKANDSVRDVHEPHAREDKASRSPQRRKADTKKHTAGSAGSGRDMPVRDAAHRGSGQTNGHVGSNQAKSSRVTSSPNWGRHANSGDKNLDDASELAPVIKSSPRRADPDRSGQSVRANAPTARLVDTFGVTQLHAPVAPTKCTSRLECELHESRVYVPGAILRDVAAFKPDLQSSATPLVPLVLGF